MNQSKYCWLGWAATFMLVAACTSTQPKTTKSQAVFLPIDGTSAPASLSHVRQRAKISTVSPSGISKSKSKHFKTVLPKNSSGKNAEPKFNARNPVDEEAHRILAEENKERSKKLLTEQTNTSSSLVLPKVQKISNAQAPRVKYGIPIRFNKRVKNVMDFYLGKGRKNLIKGIQRSGKFLPLAKKIFKEEGVPEDLVYLAGTESNYNPKARSSAGAVGLWQFMKGTASIYGLRQDRWIDERLDVVKSTHAAARHLKYLFNEFGNWELALAAYNAGEGRVKKEIKKAKARKKSGNYWSLQVPRETKRYVPDYMAITIISKNLEKYGLSDVAKESPMRRKKVKISTDFSLQEIAKRSKMPFKDLWNLNPFLVQTVPPLNQKEYEIYLPREYELRYVISLYKKPNPSKAWKTKLIHADKSAHMTELLSRYGSRTYIRVKKGDNLWNLAKKHHTTVARLRRWNDVNKKGLLKINQKLKLYIANWKVFDALIKEPTVRPKKNKKKILVVSNKKGKQNLPSADNSRQRSQSIIVQPGDTLSALSRKYQVTVNQLMKWNALKRAIDLKAYQELSISRPLEPSSSLKLTSLN
ncbi:MAG: transglycosylase SLT domain-containing protein [SAR324 cluster bacterium]|nr:transglycosylase SLT domain-containing protein [SAR324 cluster bacterium]